MALDTARVLLFGENLQAVAYSAQPATARVVGVFYITTCKYNSPWLFVGIELSFLGPVMSSLYYDIQD